MFAATGSTMTAAMESAYSMKISSTLERWL